MLLWLAAESNRYIGTATQLRCSMNGSLGLHHIFIRFELIIESKNIVIIPQRDAWAHMYVTRMLMTIYDYTLSTEDSTYGSLMQTGVYLFLMYIGLCFLDRTHVTPVLMGILKNRLSTEDSTDVNSCQCLML